MSTAAWSDTATTFTVCATGCSFTTIQAAVDASADGDVIQVYPGTYVESRTVTAADGFADFGDRTYGLFVHKDVTIQGVDASGNVITDAANVQATVIAGARSSFGAMHSIYADGVTLEGLTFKPKTDYRNKTIEVWGDGLTLRNSVVDSRGQVGGTNGAGIYFGEWTQDPAFEISSFSVEGNRFLAGGITVTNGAGTSGPVSGRVISGNTFDARGEDKFAGVSFTGRMAEIAWRPNPAGAATVTGNSFLGYGFDTSIYSAHVLVRGEMSETVDLAGILAANTFDRAALVFDGAAPRSFTYSADGTIQRTDGFAVRAGVQRAIDEAMAGDRVAAKGSHTGATAYQGGLKIDKALTLEGDGAATTTLDVRAAMSYGLQVTASNVTLRGFKMRGPQQNQSGNYGIKAEGVSTSAKNTGLTIENVTVEGSYRSGVDVNGVSGVTLTNVTSTGSGRGRGVALTDVDNATLTGITTSGNAWGGVAVATYGRYYPGGSDNVNIVSLTAAEANPIDLDLGFWAPAATAPIQPTNLTLPAGADAYRVVNAQTGTAASGFKLTNLLATEAAARAVAAANVTGLRQPAIAVKADGSMLVASGMSVQRAIDEAAPNAAIRIDAGTYTGSVNVNKPVRLMGAGTDASTGTVLAAASGSEVVLLGASGTPSNPVALNNLRISAVGKYGLNVTGTVAHVWLDGVHVVGNNPADNTETSVGLKVATAATLTDLTVLRSRFADLQYGWYLAKHGSWTGGSTVNRVSVSSTAFHHNGAKGIYAEKLSNASFQDVTVTDNGWHMSFFNAKWNAGIDINLKGNDATYENLSFDNLTATGNALGAEEGVGVTVKARSDGGTYGAYPAALSGVTFTGGTISGNERGLRFGEPGKANAGPTNVTVSGVSFVDNVSTWTGGAGLNRGLINETGAAVMAEHNWWGSAADADVAARIVNASTGSVDFDPWTGKAVPTPAPVVNTPITAPGQPVSLVFTALPTTSQPLTIRFEPAEPDASSQALPDPAATIPGATATLPATLTLTTGMNNYSFRTTVTLDVSSIPGFGPNTRIAYYNTTTNAYVPIPGTYAAGPPATYTFETDHFTTFVFYNGSAADPMDLYVSSTTSLPGTGEEFVTPNGTWSDAGSGANDWTYTGQTSTFHVVPDFPAAFGGFSSMHLVFDYNPAVMTYASAAFHADWTFSSCQDGVPSAGHVTCDMSLMGATNEVATSMTGAALSLSFTVAAPGYSELDIIGADIRRLDGIGGQEGVAVSTHGGGLRNYLGDVTARTGPASTDDTRGDGEVDFEDLSVFSNAYWAGVAGYSGGAVYLDKADIGPTTGARARTVYGTPSLDAKVDFEDLVLFAASYGLSARNVYPNAFRGEEDAVAQTVQVRAGQARREGDLAVVPVELSSVQALRGGTFAVTVGDGYEVVGARLAGALVGQREGLAFARADGAGRARVDAAVLGQEGLAGDGVFVELLVRGAGLPAASVTAGDLRDTDGTALTVDLGTAVASDADAVPTDLALEAVYPNPTRGRAAVRVAIPSAQDVDVRVYDALGREVLRVHEGALAAGHHALPIATETLSNGRYLVRMRAGSFVRAGALTVLR